MDYFHLQNKINQHKELKLEDKAILNQLLSYTLNNQVFYGTNEYLADYWNISLRTVNRVMSRLKQLNLIESTTKRKKHTDGNSSWYNKRYITVNITTLINFLGQGVETLQEEKAEAIEVKEIAEKEISILTTTGDSPSIKKKQDILYYHPTVLETIRCDEEFQIYVGKILREKGVETDYLQETKFTSELYYNYIRYDITLMEIYSALYLEEMAAA